MQLNLQYFLKHPVSKSSSRSLRTRSRCPHFFLASCIPRRASLDLTRITLHSHKRYAALPFS